MNFILFILVVFFNFWGQKLRKLKIEDFEQNWDFLPVFPNFDRFIHTFLISFTLN